MTGTHFCGNTNFNMWLFLLPFQTDTIVLVILPGSVPLCLTALELNRRGLEKYGYIGDEARIGVGAGVGVISLDHLGDMYTTPPIPAATFPLPLGSPETKITLFFFTNWQC